MLLYIMLYIVLAYLMLYIVLAYLMLFAALSNDVCLYNASFLPMISAIAFYFHKLITFTCCIHYPIFAYEFKEMTIKEKQFPFLTYSYINT